LGLTAPAALKVPSGLYVLTWWRPSVTVCAMKVHADTTAAEWLVQPAGDCSILFKKAAACYLDSDGVGAAEAHRVG